MCHFNSYFTITMENYVEDEPSEEVKALHEVLDEVVNNMDNPEFAKPGRKRSSILKQTRVSLPDTDTYTYDHSKGKVLRRSRRVSFAEKNQVLEMHTGQIYDISGKNVSDDSNENSQSINSTGTVERSENIPPGCHSEESAPYSKQESRPEMGYDDSFESSLLGDIIDATSKRKSRLPGEAEPAFKKQALQEITQRSELPSVASSNVKKKFDVQQCSDESPNNEDMEMTLLNKSSFIHEVVYKEDNNELAGYSDFGTIGGMRENPLLLDASENLADKIFHSSFIKTNMNEDLSFGQSSLNDISHISRISIPKLLSKADPDRSLDLKEPDILYPSFPKIGPKFDQNKENAYLDATKQQFIPKAMHLDLRPTLEAIVEGPHSKLLPIETCHEKENMDVTCVEPHNVTEDISDIMPFGEQLLPIMTCRTPHTMDLTIVGDEESGQLVLQNLCNNASGHAKLFTQDTEFTCPILNFKLGTEVEKEIPTVDNAAVELHEKTIYGACGMDETNIVDESLTGDVSFTNEKLYATNHKVNPLLSSVKFSDFKRPIEVYKDVNKSNASGSSNTSYRTDNVSLRHSQVTQKSEQNMSKNREISFLNNKADIPGTFNVSDNLSLAANQDIERNEQNMSVTPEVSFVTNNAGITGVLNVNRPDAFSLRSDQVETSKQDMSVMPEVSFLTKDNISSAFNAGPDNFSLKGKQDIERNRTEAQPNVFLQFREDNTKLDNQQFENVGKITDKTTFSFTSDLEQTCGFGNLSMNKRQPSISEKSYEKTEHFRSHSMSLTCVGGLPKCPKVLFGKKELDFSFQKNKTMFFTSDVTDVEENVSQKENDETLSSKKVKDVRNKDFSFNRNASFPSRYQTENFPPQSTCNDALKASTNVGDAKIPKMTQKLLPVNMELTCNLKGQLLGAENVDYPSSRENQDVGSSKMNLNQTSTGRKTLDAISHSDEKSQYFTDDIVTENGAHHESEASQSTRAEISLLKEKTCEKSNDPQNFKRLIDAPDWLVSKKTRIEGNNGNDVPVPTQAVTEGEPVARPSEIKFAQSDIIYALEEIKKAFSKRNAQGLNIPRCCNSFPENFMLNFLRNPKSVSKLSSKNIAPNSNLRNFSVPDAKSNYLNEIDKRISSDDSLRNVDLDTSVFQSEQNKNKPSVSTNSILEKNRSVNAQLLSKSSTICDINLISDSVLEDCNDLTVSESVESIESKVVHEMIDSHLASVSSKLDNNELSQSTTDNVMQTKSDETERNTTKINFDDNVMEITCTNCHKTICLDSSITSGQFLIVKLPDDLMVDLPNVSTKTVKPSVTKETSECVNDVINIETIVANILATPDHANKHQVDDSVVINRIGNESKNPAGVEPNLIPSKSKEPKMNFDSCNAKDTKLESYNLEQNKPDKKLEESELESNVQICADLKSKEVKDSMPVETNNQYTTDLILEGSECGNKVQELNDSMEITCSQNMAVIQVALIVESEIVNRVEPIIVEQSECQNFEDLHVKENAEDHIIAISKLKEVSSDSVERNINNTTLASKNQTHDVSNLKDVIANDDTMERNLSDPKLDFQNQALASSKPKDAEVNTDYMELSDPKVDAKSRTSAISKLKDVESSAVSTNRNSTDVNSSKLSEPAVKINDDQASVEGVKKSPMFLVPETSMSLTKSKKIMCSKIPMLSTGRKDLSSTLSSSQGSEDINAETAHRSADTSSYIAQQARTNSDAKIVSMVVETSSRSAFVEDSRAETVTALKESVPDQNEEISQANNSETLQPMDTDDGSEIEEYDEITKDDPDLPDLKKIILTSRRKDIQCLPKYKAIIDRISKRYGLQWTLQSWTKKDITFSFLKGLLLAKLSFESENDRTQIQFERCEKETFIKKDIASVGSSLFCMRVSGWDLIEGKLTLSKVIKKMISFSSASDEAKALIIDLKHISIKNSYSIQDDFNLTVTVTNKFYRSILSLSLPIDLFTYPSEKITPSVERIGGHDISIKEVITAVCGIQPGKNYLWNMVRAVETVGARVLTL